MKFGEDDPGLLDACDFLILLRQDIAYFEGVADTAEHEGMAERLRGMHTNLAAFEAWIETPTERENDYIKGETDDDAE